MAEIYERLQRIAEEVLRLSHSTLLVNLRFLDAALAELVPVCTPSGELATDGKMLYYDPELLLKRYADEKNVVNRDYLHALLHCLYRHNFVNGLLNEEIWDLACDITVENIINELKLESLSAQRSAAQARTVSKLSKSLKLLSAEKIYRYYVDAGISDKEAQKIRQTFVADDHALWYEQEKSSSDSAEEDKNQSDEIQNDEIRSDEAQSDESRNDESRNDESRNDESRNDEIRGDEARSDEAQSDEAQSDEAQSDESRNDESRNDEAQSDGERQDSADGAEGEPELKWGGRDNAEQEARWKEISERMQKDLETFSKDRGDKAGSLVQNLKEVNRERYDYTSFLKKFAVMGEAMKINDDEFDYVFYTYGLKLYERMPLIEPLEYKDVKRIREFAVIIDTSGSVSGELVQTFIKKTYNVLKNEESFFSKINLYIIQCDTEVQEAVKISSQNDFDAYLENMKLKGFGGTDFRPAFSYVDELIRKKEFTRLKGVIYFTDGWGIFPEKKPDYDAAFVFIRENDFNPDTPSWAIRLVLDKDEI